jgi:hypothetical protein
VKVVLTSAVCLLLGVAVAGCGRDVVVLDEIEGSKVAAMAERELEAQNPRLAPGTLSCPDLDFEVGSTVHCLRTTELSEGRVVKVRGTVEVTSRASGGRLHVAMDDDAQEFGLTGDQVAAALSQQSAKRFGGVPSHVDCPYLRGKVGTTITCSVDLGATRREVDAVVTAVDAEQYDTVYVFRRHVAPS